MNRTIYLAGPILDCTKSEANDWRGEVLDALAPHGVKAISPLRCEPIIGERYSVGYDDPKFGTARAIGSKNMFDTANCDLVLAYLPKPPEGRQQSWGTLIEIGWAHALRKPVMLVSNDPAVFAHPVVNYCGNWTLDTLDEAVETIIGLMKGY